MAMYQRVADDLNRTANDLMKNMGMLQETTIML